MAVPDDLRRLSEMQGIYLGLNLYGACVAWYEGRLQQRQRNDARAAIPVAGLLLCWRT